MLAFVYNRAGGSIAAAACWHASYNLGAAPAAAEGVIAIVVTAVVIAGAVLLLPTASRRPQPAPAHNGGD